MGLARPQIGSVPLTLFREFTMTSTARTLLVAVTFQPERWNPVCRATIPEAWRAVACTPKGQWAFTVDGDTRDDAIASARSVAAMHHHTITVEG